MSKMLKNRWSLGYNFMTGVTFGNWLKALAQNKFSVSPQYWHRAVFITLASLVNSIAAMIERLRFGKAIKQVKITQPPIFILGHWRSGTTFLHDLLAQDDEQFNFPNTFQVTNPLTFLTMETFVKRTMPWLLPLKRPMDNMTLSFDTPQEDEFATLLMTLKSVCMGFSFPLTSNQYEKYLTFREASEEDVTTWQEAMLYFCKKLSLNDKRSLLLKSPTHTGRIKFLLELFPDAKFINISRNPYRVFQSQRHLFHTAGWHTYLQVPEETSLDQGILDRYESMYDAYYDDLDLIPKGNFCEVSFEELERDPVSEVAKIYENLDLNNFEHFLPKLSNYLLTITGYQKNSFPELDEETKQLVFGRWKRNFENWGYSKTPNTGD